MHDFGFFDPRHHSQLLLGLLVMTIALLAMAMVAPELGSLDLSLGGGGGADTSAGSAAAGSASWTTDPLRTPVEVMANP